MKFTKMHGLGNDYAYVNCFEERLDGVDVAALAREISDRHRGVGSDGLILVCPSGKGVKADVRMEMYNADGSRGEMCGNGIRCVAKYAIDHRLVPIPFVDSGSTRRISVQTDRGILTLEATLQNGLVDQVRVDMGEPILRPVDIPVSLTGEQCVRTKLSVGDECYEMTCVSMGNPHAVIFVESANGVDAVDTIDAVALEQLGPMIENHALFPRRTNVHVASVQSRQKVSMRTWERGSGLTMACGTGACAVLVAGVLEGRLDDAATVHLPGGDLRIEWKGAVDNSGGSVFMTGPATEVFTGTWPT